MHIRVVQIGSRFSLGIQRLAPSHNKNNVRAAPRKENAVFRWEEWDLRDWMAIDLPPRVVSAASGGAEVSGFRVIGYSEAICAEARNSPIDAMNPLLACCGTDDPPLPERVCFSSPPPPSSRCEETSAADASVSIERSTNFCEKLSHPCAEYDRVFLPGLALRCCNNTTLLGAVRISVPGCFCFSQSFSGHVFVVNERCDQSLQSLVQYEFNSRSG